MRVALISLWTLSDIAPDALGALNKVLVVIQESWIASYLSCSYPSCSIPPAAVSW
jgi:hypothetical protein